MKDLFTVDARGLACPQPVLETKRALEEVNSDIFKVLVDNPTSKENVGRFARNQGCEVEISETAGGEFEIKIKRGDGAAKPQEQEPLQACAAPSAASDVRQVVYVGTRTMGRGDDELGIKLMRGFLQTLVDSDPLPWRIIFINSGVYLTTEDEAAVQAVTVLEDKGVEVLSCGTCLQHFGLVEKLRVGVATNMFDVIDSFNKATKVISPD